MISQAELNYNRIEKAIRFLDGHFNTQPDLDTLAEEVGMSPFHFQRMFAEWAGVSPKRFLQCLTAGYLKERLSEFQNLGEAADAVGLSSEARVYELFVKLEAVSPQIFKTGGEGLIISYGFHESPFGAILVAATERGITDIQFVAEDETDAALAALRAKWPQATLRYEPLKTEVLADHIFTPEKKKGTRLNLLVAGTQFQLKVWEALLRIPEGQVATYQHIAERIGNPKAMQAVGSAVGANPVAYLIPCHRVIRKTGVLGEYRWGSTRKQALLGWEMGQHVREEANLQTELVLK